MHWNDFQRIFVESFSLNSNRYKIFEDYKLYVEDFSDLVTRDFTHWVNGSFVTNKLNPNDLDLVTIINFEIVAEKEPIIRQRFINEAIETFYRIDGYLVIDYPEGHPFNFRTKSDLSYWSDWFSKSRMSRTQKRFPKGFVEIKFGK